jgi:hypothetical protein
MHLLLYSLAFGFGAVLLWRLVKRVFLGTLLAIGWCVMLPVRLLRAITWAYRHDVRRLGLVL